MENYIEDAVESVFAQTFKDFEVIVINDGSTTSSAEAKLKEVQDLFPDTRIYHKKNSGLASTRNYGIEKSQGSYIVCLDSDDVLAPTYLEKTAALLDKDSGNELGFVTTWLHEFGERHDVWKTSGFDVTKLLITNIVHAGSMFRKSVWLKTGGYKPQMVEGYEDWEFWLSIAELGYKWQVISEPLFYYRIRGNSMLRSQKLDHMKLYGKLYSYHEPLFAAHAKELVLESARENKQLNSAIGQKDEAIAALVTYQAEATQLSGEVSRLRDELNGMKNSRVVGRVIRLRDYVARTKPRIRRAPKKALSLIKRTLKLVLPDSVIRPLKDRLKKEPVRPALTAVKNTQAAAGKPLLSVVIPYFNRSDTIDDTIESLRSQTYRNFEVILVDDGSSDEASIKKLKHIDDTGLTLNIVRQENKGVAAARNNGISSAAGKYMVCLDSDDILEPTYLEKCVIELETNPEVKVVSSDMRLFGVENQVFKQIPYDPGYLIDHNMVTTAAVFTKEGWHEAGGYKSGIGYEDWEFWVSLAEKGYWGSIIPEPLFKYRTALSSRYVEDKLSHRDNAKKIHQLHPGYAAAIKKLYAQRRGVKLVADASGAFVNLDSPKHYKKPDNDKQNVLIAVPWMTFGGAETLILNFCKEIKDDFNLSFVTGLQAAHEWEYKFQEITPNIYHLANLFQDKDLYIEFISNYISTRHIDTLHIIHTDFVFEMLAELKKRHQGLRVIVTVFNDRAEHFSKSVHLNEHIDIFTSDNDSVRQHYVKELGGNRDIRVIPNGINSNDIYNPLLYDKPTQRAALGLEENDVSAFFIGRLSEEKNPDVFVAAANRIIRSSSGTNTKFFVIGDGIMASEIKKSVESAGSGRLQYLGYQSEVARFLSAADIFVLPSSIEGFPLSILEAMAMKVAVIASDVGAVAEVIESGKDGFVISPGSVDEIVSSIEKLADEPALLKTVKRNARQSVDKKYSNTILGDNYRKLYRAATHNKQQ